MENSYLIPLDKLIPSPTNPRKNFVDETIQELADNMLSVGQIENLIVREFKDSKGHFEIICGERRFRAAELAQMNDLLCDVRVLTDDQVLEIQISENLLREDINAMDESDAYHIFMKERDYTVEHLCKVLGKSETYIKLRLKFSALNKIWKLALRNGKVPMKAAELATTLTKTQQTMAYEAVFNYDGQFTGIPDFKSYLERNVFIRISGAEFDTTQNNLVLNTSPCTTCPKKTDNIIGLFDDIAEDVNCLDSKCFHKKSIAFYKKQYSNIINDNPELKGRLEIAGRNYHDLNPADNCDYSELSKLAPFYKGMTLDHVLDDKNLKSAAMIEAATPVMMVGIKSANGIHSNQWYWTIDYSSYYDIKEGKGTKHGTPVQKKKAQLEKLELDFEKRVDKSFQTIGAEAFANKELPFKMPRKVLELWAVNLISASDRPSYIKYIHESDWTKIHQTDGSWNHGKYETQEVIKTPEELKESNWWELSPSMAFLTMADLSELQLKKFMQHMLFSFFQTRQDDVSANFYQAVGFQTKTTDKWLEQAKEDNNEYYSRKKKTILDNFKKLKSIKK